MALPFTDVGAALARLTMGLIADWLAADNRIDRSDFASVLSRTANACRRALLEA